MQFIGVPAFMKQLIVDTTAYFRERYVALAGVVGQLNRDILGWDVIQVLVNDTIVILICTVTVCGIRVNVGFQPANPE